MSKKWCAAISFNPYVLNDDLLKSFVEFCVKNSVNQTVITEKTENAKHAHAVLLMEKWKDQKGPRLDKFKDAIIKWQSMNDENYTLACKSVTMRGCKIGYNYDWRQKYLEKNEDGHTVNIIDNLPKNYDEYLPTAEEQLKFLKDKQEKEMASCKDPFFKKLCSLFDEMEYSFDDCHGIDVMLLSKSAIFLEDCMYKSKTISVIKEVKKQREICSSFYRYYLKIVTGSRILTQLELKQKDAFEKAINEKEEG